MNSFSDRKKKATHGKKITETSASFGKDNKDERIGQVSKSVNKKIILKSPENEDFLDENQANVLDSSFSSNLRLVLLLIGI